MSIATQIARLNNNINSMKATKQEIKEAMNNDFDIIANEQIEDYAELIEDGLELYKDCIPSVETEQATEITVNDSMKYGRNKLQLFGNTEQASYEGKNLFKVGSSRTQYGVTGTQNADGSITISGTATSSGNAEIFIPDNYSSGFTAGTYTFSLSHALPEQIYIHPYVGDDATANFSISKGNTSNTKTYSQDITRFSIRFTVSAGETYNETVFMQLEQGTEPTDYEPYVGGVPSPNPNYPQPIHVVTGNNTIVVGDTNYPINLGSLELCKIGNYQDYLYKENGNWYKYGAINKTILDGTTETWGGVSTSGTFKRIDLRNTGLLNEGSSRKTHLFCNISRASTVEDYNMAFNYDNKIFFYLPQGITTYNEWKAILSQKTPKLYYILETATITQITDETLIAQLDAIWEHLQLEKGTNYITVTASDLKPYMKLIYKNYESNLTSEE